MSTSALRRPSQTNKVRSLHLNAVYFELNWLKEVIKARLTAHFNEKPFLFDELKPPSLHKRSHYGRLVNSHGFDSVKRLVLISAVASELAPDIFDFFLTQNPQNNSRYTEFGGKQNSDHAGFVPTVQTMRFLIAGHDLDTSIEVLEIFLTGSFLIENDFLQNNPEGNLNDLSLEPTINLINLVLNGCEIAPDLNPDFPANRLRSQQSYKNLVIPAETKTLLNELILWVKHERELNSWGFRSEQKGYKALFFGPSGTGKTLTATLLAKKLNREIYRIDLSAVVSKYIGETEKNLERLFVKAENRDWILFFDEADALFSKRGDVNNANDRHANQETAYLLQRIEACKNLTILASNLKENIDEAFLRRFHSIIHFPRPGPDERKKIWQQAFPTKFDLSEIDICQLSQNHDLTGAEIEGVVRSITLLAIDAGTTSLDMHTINEAIRREKLKNGRFI